MDQSVRIAEVPLSRLSEVATISSKVYVDRVMEVLRIESLTAQSEFELSEVSWPEPYLKDYDAIATDAPNSWSTQFDVSRWGFLVAQIGAKWIGTAVLAFDTPDCEMLAGRTDLAVLWDFRVAPDSRRKGVGSRLFKAAEAWALDRDCTKLKIETQNVNVPACRYYAHCGCRLETARWGAYVAFPDEVQLLWTKELSNGPR